MVRVRITLLLMGYEGFFSVTRVIAKSGSYVTLVIRVIMTGVFGLLGLLGLFGL